MFSRWFRRCSSCYFGRIFTWCGWSIFSRWHTFINSIQTFCFGKGPNFVVRWKTLQSYFNRNFDGISELCSNYCSEKNAKSNLKLLGIMSHVLPSMSSHPSCSINFKATCGVKYKTKKLTYNINSTRRYATSFLRVLCYFKFYTFVHSTI